MSAEVALAAAAPFVGSFLGTLALRLPLRQPVLLARSACPQCGKRLTSRELIPVFSWLAQMGRCRGCGKGIPAFYPVIELAAVAVMIWAAVLTTGSAFVFSTLLGWGLLTVAVADWRTFTIPDALTIPLAALGIAATFIVRRSDLTDHFIGVILGFVALFVAGEAYRRIRGRAGLGLGDAKLLAVGGAWIGWQGLPSIVILGALAALLSVLVAAVAGEEIKTTTRLPFGSFLALAIWIVWLYGPLVFRSVA